MSKSPAVLLLGLAVLATGSEALQHKSTSRNLENPKVVCKGRNSCPKKDDGTPADNSCFTDTWCRCNNAGKVFTTERGCNPKTKDGASEGDQKICEWNESEGKCQMKAQTFGENREEAPKPDPINPSLRANDETGLKSCTCQKFWKKVDTSCTDGQTSDERICGYAKKCLEGGSPGGSPGSIDTTVQVDDEGKKPLVLKHITNFGSMQRIFGKKSRDDKWLADGEQVKFQQDDEVVIGGKKTTYQQLTLAGTCTTEMGKQQQSAVVPSDCEDREWRGVGIAEMSDGCIKSVYSTGGMQVQYGNDQEHFCSSLNYAFTVCTLKDHNCYDRIEWGVQDHENHV
jgi:hypothetical protein